MPQMVLLPKNSTQFIEAAKDALSRAAYAEDECIRYAAITVPVYVQWRPTPDQARAGGCINCTYLGLWCDFWPGYERSTHGLIFLFEEGIRQRGGDLTTESLRVLLHEIDHALQRDHILQAIEIEKTTVGGVPERVRP